MPFIDILKREATNADHLYLYREAEGWCAYEQSACRLNQLFDDCLIQKVINLPYQVILIRTLISEEMMNHKSNAFAAHLHKLYQPGSEYLKIALHRQPETLFRLWKQSKLPEVQQVILLDIQ